MSEIYCPECDSEFSTKFGVGVKEAKKSQNDWYDHNAKLKIKI